MWNAGAAPAFPEWQPICDRVFGYRWMVSISPYLFPDVGRGRNPNSLQLFYEMRMDKLDLEKMLAPQHCMFSRCLAVGLTRGPRRDVR